MYLTDIYITFHPNTKDNMFFLAPHGSFYKIDHILGYKENINRYKKKNHPVSYFTTTDENWISTTITTEQ